LGFILLNHPNCNKWIGYAGILIGILIVISVLEHFGGELAPMWGQLNFLANTIFTFWLLWLSITLYRMNKTWF
jgi:hypothetical protein